ncbi:hypothetical protein ABZU78_12915 [Rhodococcus erythropolis]|uniref:hypothetical protein n=1 Tax=Rhodococcus erythropolis TaxID=1833 RepID=UPI00242B09F9|nr:hypothetical protein [Rhodococcus erythropolis]
MKKYIGILAIALFAVACSNTQAGTPVAMSVEDQAQYDLEHLFQVTGVSDSALQGNCTVIEGFAKDRSISEKDLAEIGRYVATVVPYKWPQDQNKILSVILMSTFYYCSEYYYMFGK